MFWNQDINDFNGFRKQFVINILLLRKDTGSAIERVYNVYYLDAHNMWFLYSAKAINVYKISCFTIYQLATPQTDFIHVKFAHL